ncbi:hypothetical protein [Furfurilactobacillus siliginis]|nr:hypothetical protein [Furfurilactobacillus siliginis]
MTVTKLWVGNLGSVTLFIGWSLPDEKVIILTTKKHSTRFI